MTSLTLVTFFFDIVPPGHPSYPPDTLRTSRTPFVPPGHPSYLPDTPHSPSGLSAALEALISSPAYKVFHGFRGTRVQISGYEGANFGGFDYQLSLLVELMAAGST